MNHPGEFYFLRHSLRQLRDQLLASTVRSELKTQLGGRRTPSKIVISSSEINDRHGTGVLLGRVFDPSDIVSLISRRDHQVDSAHIQIQVPDPLYHRERAREVFLSVLREHTIDAVLVVPHFVDEVRAALLLREISEVPIIVWMMDDPSLGATRIPRDVLKKLLALSSLRFAISPAMALAYEEEFVLPFHVLPPTVSRREAAEFALPAREEAGGILDRSAIMLGNIWNRQWFHQLTPVLQATDWQIDWFGPAADRHDEFSSPQIAPKGFLEEHDIRETLARYPFAILATGTADQHDAMRTLTLWSFPSRLVFLFAACQIPVLVIGASESCAARMVEALGVGVHCRYDALEFRAAAERLSDTSFRLACRKRCRAAADLFYSEGLSEWIWEAGKSGRLPDARFGFLELMKSDCQVPTVLPELTS